MADNFRHAQYREDGTQIDDPQKPIDDLIKGTLTESVVVSTVGTPGELRRLSDGPNKGVVLMWSQPEGRDTYTWCWQIYPLASYL